MTAESGREYIMRKVTPERRRDIMEWLDNLPDLPEPEPCAGEHRGPEGPNEDLGWCYEHQLPSFTRRPEGEEYGGHLADCSLPRDHASYCVGGGEGHPPAAKVRGYWPEERDG